MENNIDQTLKSIWSQLNNLQSLQDNWDSEDAPRPSELAISLAKDVLVWANNHNLEIESVDPDVMGGVAVYLSNDSKSIWFCLRNDGSATVVASQDGAMVWSTPLNLETLKECIEFYGRK